MNKGHFRTLLMGAVGMVLVAAMLVTGAWMAQARTASAQDATATPVPAGEPAMDASSPSQLPRTITVVGEGKVRVQPDVARINIGVETLRMSVREATDANNETVDAVLAALAEAGIAEDDIQTSGFNVYAERFGPQGPLPEDQVNYRVSNTVNVLVRDLTAISAVLDAAINAGANNIYGIEFTLDDTAAAEAEARAAAIENAGVKAQDIASLTGVTVGRVVSVSEVVAGQPYYNAFRSAAMGMGGGGEGPAIQPGQLSLSMQLQVVYEITGDAQ